MANIQFFHFRNRRNRPNRVKAKTMTSMGFDAKAGAMARGKLNSV